MGGAGGIADRGQLYMGAPPYWCSRYTFANEASHLRAALARGVLLFGEALLPFSDLLSKHTSDKLPPQKMYLYEKIFSSKMQPL